MSVLDTLTGTSEQHPIPPSKEPVMPHVMIVPYNAILDAQADAFLPWMWKRMQKDDLVDYYFPGQRDTGFATFVRLFSGDGNVALVVTDAKTGQWEDTIAGFITWTPQRMGASDIIVAGCVFFREFWDHRTTDATAVESFKFWFTEAKAQVVLGVCPSLHTAITRFNRRIGFREIGKIPGAHLYKGEVCDAVLWAITRSEWELRGH
jgi:RimJ/RimL family protein N-acetyltransferase